MYTQKHSAGKKLISDIQSMSTFINYEFLVGKRKTRKNTKIERIKFSKSKTQQDIEYIIHKKKVYEEQKIPFSVSAPR